MGMTPQQQRHEELIRATAETLGRSLTREDKANYQAQLYRLIRERDQDVATQLELERMERAKG